MVEWQTGGAAAQLPDGGLSRATKRVGLALVPRIRSASFSTKTRYSRMPIRFASAASSSLTRQTSSCQSLVRSPSRVIDIAWFSSSAEFGIHADIMEEENRESSGRGSRGRGVRGRRPRGTRCTRPSRRMTLRDPFGLVWLRHPFGRAQGRLRNERGDALRRFAGCSGETERDREIEGSSGCGQR